MLNEILSQLRRYEMVQPGDRVVCAVSGGADSVALLFAMYLLREKLDISVEAAHFNHHLRGAESDGDEAFVRELCHRYDIPLHVGQGTVTAGEKGLEAAARDARYGFFAALSGKIATAHTADDNAETVLLHLVRGTGLKGLGGISPVRGNIIRPMLTVTREQVTAFLAEYHLDHISDSSNETDLFLRNRLRHHVMPLLRQENPRLAENLSAMAMRLREDEQALEALSAGEMNVTALRQMHPAVRSRALARFLEESGVREPEAAHIRQAEQLVFTDRPSAKANFPGGVTICRKYDTLSVAAPEKIMETQVLHCPGSVELPHLGLRIVCQRVKTPLLTTDGFTVCPRGQMVVRSRQAGDTMRLRGGTKELKKLFIDRKIPAEQRMQIPVIGDDGGVLGVWKIGANLDRVGDEVLIRFETVRPSDKL